MSLNERVLASQLQSSEALPGCRATSNRRPTRTGREEHYEYVFPAVSDEDLCGPLVWQQAEHTALRRVPTGTFVTTETCHVTGTTLANIGHRPQ